MKTPTALAALTLALAPVATEVNPEASLAIEVLSDITVTEDHSMDDYDRDSFAPNGWIDTTGNGCTAREDVLARDLDEETLAVNGCTVEYGQTVGAYSGETIEHVHGDSQVDIDHVVAIGQAWRNGAHAWDEATRQAFYQDKENLIAVSSLQNQAKGAKDVTDYLPANQGAYCEYAATTVYIKDKYGLAMNSAEHQFMTDLLSDPECAETPAAPAQAIYTSDWQARPSASQAPSPTTSLLDLPLPVLAGILTAAVLALSIFVFSRKARIGLFRIVRQYTRRTVRRGIKSLTR